MITKFEITTDDGYKYTFGKDNLEGVEQSQLVTTSLVCRFKYQSAGWYDWGNGVRDYLYARAPLLNNLGDNVDDVFSRDNNKSLSTYYYFNSSWHVTSVSAPSGDVMDYGYESVDEVSYIADKSYSVTTPALQENEYPINGSLQWVFTTRIPPQNNKYPHLQTFTFSVNEVNLKGKRLYSIKGKNGNTAYFDHLTDRKDLVGDKRLDKIRIVVDNKTVKTFTFRYDSTVATKDEEVIDLTPLADNDFKVFLSTDSDFANQKYTLLEDPKPDVNTYNEKYIKIFAGEHIRYYLREIKEYGLENKFVGSYLMTYYYPEKLPRRFSPKQDLCGFLNNNASGTTIPFLMYNPLWGPTFWVPRSTGPLFGWCNKKNKNYITNGSGAQLADRSPNATLCQSGTLKTLVFPIQGSKLFKYELNKLPGETPTSGLRVKEIITYPSIFDTTNFIREKYNYSNPSEVTARAYSYHLELTNFEEVITINSQPYNPQYLTKGGIVGYKEVTVSQTNNGKIVYTFLNPQDIPNIKPIVTEVGDIEGSLPWTVPFSDETDNDWKRGLLKKTYIYDSNNKLIKRTFNDYELNAAGNDAKTVYGLLPLVYTDAKINMKRRRASRYTYISNWLYLKSTTDTTYDQSDNTRYNISTTSYTYNTNKHLATTKTADSEKREVSTTFRYPYDFAAAKGTNGSMGKLVTKNILSTPIEELAWLDGKLVAGKVKDYDEFSGLLLPKSESVLEINSPVAATTPVNADPAIPFTGFNKKINFVSYYKDNLLQYSEEGNISKSYIWGYNDQFPIAEVVNAASNQIAYTSFEVAEELGGWTLTGTNKVYDNEGKTGVRSYKGDLSKSGLPLAKYTVTLWAKGSGNILANNELRILNPGWNYCIWEFDLPITEVKILTNGNKIDEVRLYPKNSQMATYIYDPYLGVICTASANNNISYYEYDKAGRLHLIKDHKGNIVKRLDYNYQAR